MSLARCCCCCYMCYCGSCCCYSYLGMLLLSSLCVLVAPSLFVCVGCDGVVDVDVTACVVDAGIIGDCVCCI